MTVILMPKVKVIVQLICTIAYHHIVCYNVCQPFVSKENMLGGNIIETMS